MTKKKVVLTPEYLSRNGSEDAHQSALFAWLNMATKFGVDAANDMESYGSLDYVMNKYGETNRIDDLADAFAIPNGGQRHKAVASKMKATGTKKGVLDIFWLMPVGKWHGLFLEMKVGSNKLSVEQKNFVARATKKDYCCQVAYSWQEAVHVFGNYYQGNYNE